MPETEAYAGLEPGEVWRHFAALNGIPRPSGQEAAAREYVRSVAAACGAGYSEDSLGNCCVRVPATAGKETTSAVAIQAHLDMVCEQRPGTGQDFHRDPIRPRREGDWIYGSSTTLGADNGIGAAAALAVLTTPGLVHGPLELLFTVEEETGLVGAQGLDPNLLTAQYLVNLDSEDPRKLTVGCAGGGGVTMVLPVHTVPAEADSAWREVRIGGLKGGHSGVQIHEPLANAIKLLVGILQEAESQFGIRLSSIRGGNAHNAIPREAVAVVSVPSSQMQAFDTWLAAQLEPLRTTWAAYEPGLELTSRILVDGSAGVLEESAAVLALLADLPHGPLAWSRAFEGKVETSCNLAQVEIGPGGGEVACSVRSFVNDSIRALQQQIRGRAEAVGAAVTVRDGYPGWEPNPHSHLLEVTRKAFAHVVGQEPVVEVIHAGLECGVLAAKRPGLEAISFGPTIEGAHTPEERVRIPDVATTWAILIQLLRDLAEE